MRSEGLPNCCASRELWELGRSASSTPMPCGPERSKHECLHISWGPWPKNRVLDLDPGPRIGYSTRTLAPKSTEYLELGRSERACSREFFLLTEKGTDQNHANCWSAWEILRTETYSDVCGSVADTAQSVINDSTIISQACQIRDRFQHVNALFSAVQRAVGHCKEVSDSDLREARHCVTRYMAFYRHTFPTCSVTPKQHILESHDWMGVWGVGFRSSGGNRCMPL